MYSHKDLANKIVMINNELEKVTDWFKANKLSINVDKTNFMTMGTPQKNIQIQERYKCSKCSTWWSLLIQSK